MSTTIRRKQLKDEIVPSLIEKYTEIFGKLYYESSHMFPKESATRALKKFITQLEGLKISNMMYVYIPDPHLTLPAYKIYKFGFYFDSSDQMNDFIEEFEAKEEFQSHTICFEDIKLKNEVPDKSQAKDFAKFIWDKYSKKLQKHFNLPVVETHSKQITVGGIDKDLATFLDDSEKAHKYSFYKLKQKYFKDEKAYKEFTWNPKEFAQFLNWPNIFFNPEILEKINRVDFTQAKETNIFKKNFTKLQTEQIMKVLIEYVSKCLMHKEVHENTYKLNYNPLDFLHSLFSENITNEKDQEEEIDTKSEYLWTKVEIKKGKEKLIPILDKHLTKHLELNYQKKNLELTRSESFQKKSQDDSVYYHTHIKVLFEINYIDPDKSQDNGEVFLEVQFETATKIDEFEGYSEGVIQGKVVQNGNKSYLIRRYNDFSEVESCDGVDPLKNKRVKFTQDEEYENDEFEDEESGDDEKDITNFSEFKFKHLFSYTDCIDGTIGVKEKKVFNNKTKELKLTAYSSQANLNHLNKEFVKLANDYDIRHGLSLGELFNQGTHFCTTLAYKYFSDNKPLMHKLEKKATRLGLDSIKCSSAWIAAFCGVSKILKEYADPESGEEIFPEYWKDEIVGRMFKNNEKKEKLYADNKDHKAKVLEKKKFITLEPTFLDLNINENKDELKDLYKAYFLDSYKNFKAFKKALEGEEIEVSRVQNFMVNLTCKGLEYYYEKVREEAKEAYQAILIGSTEEEKDAMDEVQEEAKSVCSVPTYDSFLLGKALNYNIINMDKVNELGYKKVVLVLCRAFLSNDITFCPMLNPEYIIKLPL